MSNSVLMDKDENILNPKIPRYEKKNYIVAYLNENQVISRGNNYTFNMATAEKEGNCFELDSTNKQIKVLKDCVALLSASTFVDKSTGEGYVHAKVFINGENVASNLTRIINRDYTVCSVPAKAISLKANDVIQMKIDYTSDSGNPQIRASNDCSFVSVVKI